MLSGKCVLIAVFLQLCLCVHVVKAEYQFGDMIEFPGTVYSHYAVYVGGLAVEGKTEDQNIFEMIRKPTPGCRFTTKTGPFRVNNYLDNTITKQSTANMKNTIQKLMKSDICAHYDLMKGNCEHIATMVRYGIAYCKQPGTAVGKVLGLGRKKRHEASAAA